MDIFGGASDSDSSDDQSDLVTQTAALGTADSTPQSPPPVEPPTAVPPQGSAAGGVLGEAAAAAAPLPTAGGAVGGDEEKVGGVGPPTAGAHDDADPAEGKARDGEEEGRGEGVADNSTSPAAKPRKTLPKAKYDGPPNALIEECDKESGLNMDTVHDLLDRGIGVQNTVR